MARPPRSSSGRRSGPDPAAARTRPPARLCRPDLERALARADEALGLALPAGFPRQIETYLDELDRWQRIGRLTAYEDRATRLRHLVLESLMLLAVLPAPASPLLDIGSGPGVPGLILKLARPDWDVVLLDATRRRHLIDHRGRTVGRPIVDDGCFDVGIRLREDASNGVSQKASLVIAGNDD